MCSHYTEVASVETGGCCTLSVGHTALISTISHQIITLFTVSIAEGLGQYHTLSMYHMTIVLCFWVHPLSHIPYFSAMSMSSYSETKYSFATIDVET